MKPKEFCYWLMGSLELGNIEELDKEQTKTLKRHLNMVFAHVAHDPENTSYKIGSKPPGPQIPAKPSKPTFRPPSDGARC